MNRTSHNSAVSTIDPAEIERFSRIAGEWWDPAGKFAPLHRLNPVRIGFIRDRAAAHWARDALSGTPLQGLSVLDIGCGGGLLSEPMARLGTTVTGVDAGARNIAVAALHADEKQRVDPGIFIGVRTPDRFVGARDTRCAGASRDHQIGVGARIQRGFHFADAFVN